MEEGQPEHNTGRIAASTRRRAGAAGSGTGAGSGTAVSPCKLRRRPPIPMIPASTTWPTAESPPG